MFYENATYSEIENAFDTNARWKSAKKIANNTWILRHEDCFAMKLHNTEIVKWYPDGRIVIDTDGWKTPTTKERINRILPPGFSLYQERGVWYLQQGRWNEGTRHVFEDGITLTPNDDSECNRFFDVSGQGEDPKALLRKQRQIKMFAKKFVEAFLKGEVPKPDLGDCMICRMFPDSYDKEHLDSHIEENYFVPSLLARVVNTSPRLSIFAKAFVSERWKGHRDINDHHGIAKEQLTKALVHYMREQYGMVR